MTVDWTQRLPGRFFRTAEGAVVAIDYDFYPCDPERETVGVMGITPDGYRGGTTTNGRQYREGLDAGWLVEIPRAEFRECYLASRHVHGVEVDREKYT